jgi:hypothetical protein
MPATLHVGRRTVNQTVGCLVVALFLLAVESVSATTYVSAEPIPSEDVVGTQDLSALLSIGYVNLERWSQRLLTECRTVDNVLDTLAAHGAIGSVSTSNTQVVVAAGGFEAITDPSFVFTLQDTGAGSVNAADVNVLDNALGYVLSQSGTTHFSPDNPKAYAFTLDYAVVTFTGTLTGDQARQFFDRVGTVDPALWSGQFAGFTQIDFAGSSTNNSMLFLKPAASKHRLASGLFEAVETEPRATYSPLKNNDTPTTARAGVAFPGNDWLAFPDGDDYLVNIGDSSQLRDDLALLRQRHLDDVALLLDAIANNRVETFLGAGFSCSD